MKRVIALLGVVLLTFAANNPYDASASRFDRTIVLRVKAADSIKPLRFSGWYKQDESDARQEVTGKSAPFGIKMNTNSLRAAFRKQSGESEMRVEVIEFLGERENGCVTGAGDNLEVFVDTSGDACRMSVRAIPRP